eukprot:244529_1
MTPQRLLSLTLLYALVCNIKSIPIYCSSFGDVRGGGLEDLYVIRCIPVGAKAIHAYAPPILIKTTNDAFGTYNNFYYDAQNIPQIPWGAGNEVVYFLYDNCKAWQTELDVLKIEFSKPSTGDDILQVQIEGAYTSHININHKLYGAKQLPKDAVASSYLGGNLMWSKVVNGIQQYKTKNSAINIDSNGIWTLSDHMKTMFNKYKNHLLELLAAQKAGKLFKINGGGMRTYSFYYNPDVARGTNRWRVSRVHDGTAKIYAFPHTKYGIITYVKPDEYSYSDKGKKYTIKIRITKVDGSSKVVMWINDDKDNKIDGTTIYWDNQDAGECTRNTLNNVAGKNKYPAGSCSELKNKLDELKAQHVDRQIRAYFDPSTYSLGEYGESFTAISYIAVFEILHEEYMMIHFDTNALSRVIGREDEAKRPKLWKRVNDILKELLIREDVKGLVVRTGNHIHFARKVKSQATDKTKIVFDYWLNVDSISTYGPVAMDEVQFQLEQPGQWIVVVFDKQKVTVPSWFTDPKVNIFFKYIHTWEAKREILIPVISSKAESEMSNMYYYDDDITDYNIIQFNEEYDRGYVISELNYWNRMNMIILIGFSMMILFCIGYLCSICSLCVALFAYEKSKNSFYNDIDLIMV